MTSRAKAVVKSAVRRWPRYQLEVPIRVIVQVQAKVAIFDGRGNSLSLGGMAMYAGAELKMGDQVAVEFTPPYSSPPVRVDAVICNRTGYYYGLEFLNATSSQQEQTARFQRQLSTLTSAADRAPSC
jgi:hypothetical protein